MAILGWILGLFFALSSILFVKDSLIFSLLCAAISILTTPLSYRLLTARLNLHPNNLVRFGIILLLFLIALDVYPSKQIDPKSEMNVSENKEKNTQSINAETEKEKIPTPTPLPSPTLTPSPLPQPTPTLEPLPTPTYIIHVVPTSPPPPPISSEFSCDCSKTCKDMASCNEAYYQLNTCGCSRRDGDHDGVPCEDICD